MGQALLRVAEKISSLTVTRVERGQDAAGPIATTDVVVDFTTPEAALVFARLCAKNKKSIVIGTTGFGENEGKELQEISRQIPMVLSSNFSTGVNALFWLTAKAVEILGPDYDLEIVEMHHRLKKDAPSGTARSLAQILAKARQLQLDKVAKYGREGLIGERPTTEIGIHSIRGGDVVGDNSVIFANTGERLELTHKASSRETFAGGALRAAQWIVGKSPGLYDMQDVLGLK